MKKIFTILFSVVILSAFSQTADRLAGCIPLTVNFTAPVANTYFWEFGTGDTSELANPQYTFEIAGTYNVNFKETRNGPIIGTVAINALDLPIIEFTTTPNPPQGCEGPLLISFQNISSNTTTSGGTTSGLRFSWTFHDATTSSATNAPNKVYNGLGDYPVRLVGIDGNECRNEFTRNVTIGVPISRINIPDSLCINSATTMGNNSSAGKYAWTFTSANVSSSTSFQPIVSFTAGGFQTVTLTVTSEDGQCSDVASKQVFIEAPEVSFTSTPSYVCYEPVNVSFTSQTNDIVKNYNWFFGDRGFSNNPNPTHTYIIPDSIYSRRERTIYSTRLLIETPNGCTTSFSKNDTIFPVWARFTPDKTKGCAPLTVAFFDSSRSNEPIITWRYDFGDGTIQNYNTKGPHNHTYADTGTFEVKLTTINSSGCRDDSYSTFIQVGQQIPLDFSVDNASPCTTDPVQFTNLTANANFIDAWHYSDQNQRISHCYGNDAPAWRFSKENSGQNITLTAEHNGCYSTVTKPNLLSVNGPVASFNYLYNCNSKDNITLTNTSNFASSISWDLGDGNTSTANSFSHTYATPGNYKIVLTANSLSCPPVKDSIEIEIRHIKADFLNDSILCGNRTYSFDATPSEDVTSNCYRGYTWLFGDTSIRPITTPNPIENIRLPKSGTQFVKLITEDVNGCLDSITKNVRVFNLTPIFTSNIDTTCLPDTLLFTDLSRGDTTLTRWSWNFGDNTSITNNTNVPVSHIYNQLNDSNKFAVRLTLMDTLGCVAARIFTVNTYKVISTVSYSPRAPNKCLGEIINFTATDFTSQGSSLNFLWNFGDGDTSTTQNPQHLYRAEGNYLPKLYFTEKSSGCSDSAEIVVNFLKVIGLNEDTVQILGGITDTTYCGLTAIGMDLSATSPTAGVYNWFTVGGTFVGKSDTVQSVQIQGPGVYGVELASEFGCGVDTAIITVVRDSLASASIANANTVVCADKNVKVVATFGIGGTYSWYRTVNNTKELIRGPRKTPIINNTTDTILIDANSANSLVNIDDSTMFLVIHTNTCSVDSDSVMVRVVPEIMDVSLLGPLNLCEQNTDTLFVSSNSTNYASTKYNWNTNSTIPDSIGIINGSQVFLVTGSGSVANYTVDVYNESCGLRSQRIRIIPNYKPKNITINTLDSNLCIGETTLIFGNSTSGTAPLTYTWYRDSVNMLLPTTTKTITPNLTAPDSVTYYFTVTNHCTQATDDTSSRLLSIVIDTLPVVNVSVLGDTSLCQNGILFLNVDSSNNIDYNTIFWSNGDRGLPLRVTIPGNYVVSVNSARPAACIGKNSFTVDTCNADIYAPTAFTPGNDNLNNVFKIEGKGIIDLKYTIYDRWGIIVYEATHKNQTWDGTKNNKLVPLGTYIWYAEYSGNFIGDKVEQRKKSGIVVVVK